MKARKTSLGAGEAALTKIVFEDRHALVRQAAIVKLSDPAVLAGISGGDLLAEVLRSPVFTQEDVAELSESEIPEVRRGAIANISGEILLAKIAIRETDPDIGEAAIERHQ